MHLIRLLIQGRTAELAGYPALDQDRRMRTIGLDRLARRQAAILNPGNAALFQKYADGVNAFIVTAPQALHLEFRLAGISPEPWTVTDSLSLLYFWVLPRPPTWTRKSSSRCCCAPWDTTEPAGSCP